MQVLILLSSFIALAVAAELPSISIETAEREVDYLKFKLEINDTDNTINSYKLFVHDEGSREGFITYEGEKYIDLAEKTAKAIVHNPNQAYNVCLSAELTQNASQELGVTMVTECLVESTIKKMQLSSIIGLALTLIFFFGCFLVGYVSWKCAVCKMSSKEEYDKSDITGNGDIVPLTQLND